MWNGHGGISNSQSKGRVSDNVTPLYSIDILGYRVIDLKTELEEIDDLDFVFDFVSDNVTLKH